uniref:Uncharacterized protein n=1 Tax=Arundo donax TaxID=35708 RepID=A0A0A9H1P8_ARUDO
MGVRSALHSTLALLPPNNETWPHWLTRSCCSRIYLEGGHILLSYIDYYHWSSDFQFQ